MERVESKEPRVPDPDVDRDPRSERRGEGELLGSDRGTSCRRRTWCISRRSPRRRPGSPATTCTKCAERGCDLGHGDRRVGGGCFRLGSDLPRLTRTSCYTKIVGVKNVTVTLDEETARWARIEAARRDMSVSSLLRELILEHMGRREAYEGAMTRFLSRPPAKLGGRRPTREEVHDRAGLR